MKKYELKNSEDPSTPYFLEVVDLDTDTIVTSVHQDEQMLHIEYIVSLMNEVYNQGYDDCKEAHNIDTSKGN